MREQGKKTTVVTGAVLKEGEGRYAEIVSLCAERGVNIPGGASYSLFVIKFPDNKLREVVVCYSKLYNLRGLPTLKEGQLGEIVLTKATALGQDGKHRGLKRVMWHGYADGQYGEKSLTIIQAKF